MKLQSPVRHSTPSDDNLIPMINVVFLLLIFFMVAGTIRPSDPLPINAPQTLSGVQQKAQPVLYIATNGAMVLNETPVAPDQLVEALTTLLTATGKPPSDVGLTSSAVSSADFPSTPSLAIKADAATPVARLRQILEDARIAGVHSVELITLRTPTLP